MKNTSLSMPSIPLLQCLIFGIIILVPSIQGVYVCPSFPHHKCNCNPMNGTKLKCPRLNNVEELSSPEFLMEFFNITQLDLSSNNITHLRPYAFPFPSLLKLHLERNIIETIEDYTFSNLTSLKLLVLSNNKLRNLRKEMFAGLKSVDHLKLNQNLITTISSDTFDFMESLNKLNITGNPLICNCDIRWLQISRIKLSAPNPRCESPPSLHGRIIDKRGPFNAECNERSKSSNIVLQIFPIENQVVFENDSLTLICRSDERVTLKDHSESYIKWTWDGKNVATAFDNSVELQNLKENDSNVEDLKESVLIINNISEKHSGEWSCNLYHFQNLVKQSSIRIEIITKNTVYCPFHTTDNDKGKYFWPQTIAGHKVDLPCEISHLNHTDLIQPLLATHFCSHNGSWQELNTDKCPYVSAVTTILQRFSKMNLTEHKPSLIESAVNLHNYTCENLVNISNVVDVHFFVSTVENYINFTEQESELGIHLIRVVACILRLPKRLLAKAQQRHLACSRLITAIESITKNTPALEFHSRDWVIKELQAVTDSFVGISCAWSKHINDSNLSCSSTNLTIVPDENAEIWFQIPSHLFDNRESKRVRFNLAVFSDGRLFPDHISDRESSSVLYINLHGVKITRIDSLGIFITVKNDHSIAAPTLAWWDPDSGSWIREGCHLIALYSLPSKLAFRCDRFGYYSLMTDQQANILLTEKNIQRKLLLRFLPSSIYISTFISVTCLLLAAATYCFCYVHIQMSKKMKHSLVNTWFSASFFFLIFSVGVHQTESDGFCQIVGLTIHYFALATLFWMAVTIKAIYKRVQKSGRSISTPSEDISPDLAIEKPILGIYLFGWGISCILCGIAAAVNLKGYSSPNYCFLVPGPALSIVLIPASLILFYLFVMCLLVKCAVSSPDSNPQLSVGTQAIDLDLLDGGYGGYGGVSASADGGRSSFAAVRYGSVRSVTTSSSQVEDTEHSPMQQLKAFVILLVLYLAATTSAAVCVMLPLQWAYEEKLFSLIYAVVCLLMGVFVLFFHCFARNDVRTAWNRLRTRRSGNKPLQMCSQVIANSLLLNPTNTACAAGEMQPTIPAAVSSTLPILVGDGMLEAPTLAPLDDSQMAAASRFLKHPAHNVNFIRLHRQHYRENCNSATIADNFYNPHQSIVAKKFFKKQRRKRNTLQVRKCRSGGSSPVSSSVAIFDKVGINLPANMMAAARAENENGQTFPQRNGTLYNDHEAEMISEKHPLTYDEPDITEGECELKTCTESEATFTVPEYTEIPENRATCSNYRAETREQMCGTSDRDWCSCDAASDVNSEPTYNYAYVRNGYASSRSALSDNSSVNSHLYTSVAPDVVHSAMPSRSTRRRTLYHRLPSRPRSTKAAAAPRDYFKYTNFTSEPDADVDIDSPPANNYVSKHRPSETDYKIMNNHNHTDSVSSEEKVETRV